MKKIRFYEMASQRAGIRVSDIPADEAIGRFVRVSDVLALAPIDQCFQWLALHGEYEKQLKLKWSDGLAKIEAELEAKVQEHSELEGFDFKEENPFLFMIDKKSLTVAELIELKEGDTQVLRTEAVEEFTTTVMDYNFGYEFAETLPDFFKEAEDKMRKLSKRDRWAARGSWNAFVPKQPKKRKEVNFEFLKRYKRKPRVKKEG